MNIKEVLKCCEHYDDVVIYDFLEDDIFSLDFIEFYQYYIYNTKELSEERRNMLHKLDMIAYKYISDNRFRKALKNDNVELSLEAIFKFFDDYKEKEIKNISNTVWI